MGTIARDKLKEWSEEVGWSVKGGLKVDDEHGGDAIIIANAAVIVSLDDGAG